MTRLAIALSVLLCVPLAAQAPAPGAPADRWTQFRGSPALTGTSAATLPATPKLLWTYDAGDAIESSAAIADGVVYVGSRTGELHAVLVARSERGWWLLDNRTGTMADLGGRVDFSSIYFVDGREIWVPVGRGRAN